jgi:hypothetical protein
MLRLLNEMELQRPARQTRRVGAVKQMMRTQGLDPGSTPFEANCREAQDLASSQFRHVETFWWIRRFVATQEIRCLCAKLWRCSDSARSTSVSEATYRISRAGHRKRGG